MSLTINLVLYKRKKRKNGEIPVYLRITENRKSRYKSTGIAVLSKYWNKERQEVRATHPRSKVLNDDLEFQLLQAEKTKNKLKQGEKLDLNSLKSHIKEKKHNTLTSHAESYLELLDQNDNYWEHKRFKVLLNQLKEFIGKKTITLPKVDANFIESFQNYLLTGLTDSKGNPAVNSPNTVRRKLTTLKGMFNHLIKTKKMSHDPFLMVSQVKEEPVERTKLTTEQIRSIEELDLDEGSSLWHTRNYFMYSFYNAGIRFGDLCTITWGNLSDGRLTYRMRKTGSIKNIKQLKPMEAILDQYRSVDTSKIDYIFPILDKQISEPRELQRAISSKNAIINRNLDKNAEIAGIQSTISFHVSRHSFSQYALENGLDLYQISKALGHSKLKTTERYLKAFNEELLDEGMDQLFKN